MNTRREPDGKQWKGDANQNGNQEDDWKRYSVAVVGRVGGATRKKYVKFCEKMGGSKKY